MLIEFKKYQVEGVGKLIKDSKRRHIWTFDRQGESYTVMAVDSLVSNKFRVKIQASMLYDDKITDEQKKRGLEFEFANMTIKIKKILDNRFELFVNLHKFKCDEVVNEKSETANPGINQISVSNGQLKDNVIKFKKSSEHLHTPMEEKKTRFNKQSLRNNPVQRTSTQVDKNFNDLIMFDDEKDDSSDDDFQNFDAKTKIRRTVTDKPAHNNKLDGFARNDFGFGFGKGETINKTISKPNAINFKEGPKAEPQKKKMVNFDDDFLDFETDVKKPEPLNLNTFQKKEKVLQKGPNQFSQPLQVNKNLAEPEVGNPQPISKQSGKQIANRGFLDNNIFDKLGKNPKEANSVPADSKKKGFDFDFDFGNLNQKRNDNGTEEATKPQPYTMDNLPRDSSQQPTSPNRKVDKANCEDTNSNQEANDRYAALNLQQQAPVNPFDDEATHVPQDRRVFTENVTSNDNIGENNKNYSFNPQCSNSNCDFDNQKVYQENHQPQSNDNMIAYDENEAAEHNNSHKYDNSQGFDLEDISPIKGAELYEPDIYKRMDKPNGDTDAELKKDVEDLNLANKFDFGEEVFNPFDTSDKEKRDDIAD